MTCFVVIGFGQKTDYSTGRVLDLDKSWALLIKPALERVGVRAFRAIDVNRSGSIDEVMYRWIYHADLVVADISTLNANVLYELGVRHAQRPATTIIMAEREVLSGIPFDLGHTVIHSYEHLGDHIPPSEVERFVAHLAELVQGIIDVPLERDSPVYTYLRGMRPPALEEGAAGAHVGLSPLAVEDPLTELIELAEAAKHRSDFGAARAHFREAVERSGGDVFLTQRLALVTYKEHEQDADDGTAIDALQRAQRVLAPCKPDLSTDPETLGLAGAIEKRLFERTGDAQHLERSIRYYERGFYVKQDYYNGINAAFLYNLKANQAGDDFDAIVNFGHARRLRERVAEICRELVQGADFDARGDAEWVYQTLAQAYLGLDDEEGCRRLVPKIQALSKGSFDLATFKRQNEQLLAAIATFHARKLPVATGAGTPTGTPPPAPGEAIVIDLGPHKSRPIRSLDVRIEFE
jgi:hypothetical protein